MNDGPMSMKAFCQRTGLNPVLVRGLEIAGVVKPVRMNNVSRWRVFTTADVNAALRWKAEEDERRRVAPERGV
jgi:hypothetical protein